MVWFIHVHDICISQNTTVVGGTFTATDCVATVVGGASHTPWETDTLHTWLESRSVSLWLRHAWPGSMSGGSWERYCAPLEWNKDVTDECLIEQCSPSRAWQDGRERLTLYFIPLVSLPGHSELVSSERASVPGYVVTRTLYKQHNERERQKHTWTVSEYEVLG